MAKAPTAQPLIRLTELEALRGIAALVVFIGHFFEGLVPVLTLYGQRRGLIGFFDGPPVILFFVLSGFVLVLRPLADCQLSILPRLALRRWPRLAGTVSFAALFYIVAAKLGAFPPLNIASQVHGVPPPYLSWGMHMDDGHIVPVMREALIGAFLHESSIHNGVLWTMHWELLGSFLAYLLASVVIMNMALGIRIACFVAISFAATLYSPWFASFPVGVAMAWLHLRGHWRFQLSVPVAILASVVSLLLWSWDVRFADGLWAWTDVLGMNVRIRLWVLAEALAGVTLMAIALYAPSFTAALRTSAGHWAGRLSFPIYLIHLLIMLSLGVWLTILASPVTPLGVMMIFAVTLAATILLALPVATFDRWWTRLVASL